MKKTASSRRFWCVCGKCGSCVDNDRWERIFQEKFGQQERDYYAAGLEPRSAGVSAKAFADASIFAWVSGDVPQTGRSREQRRIDHLLRKNRYTHTAA
jgi:hypothetical protein